MMIHCNCNSFFFFVLQISHLLGNLDWRRNYYIRNIWSHINKNVVAIHWSTFTSQPALFKARLFIGCKRRMTAGWCEMTWSVDTNIYSTNIRINDINNVFGRGTEPSSTYIFVTSAGWHKCHRDTHMTCVFSHQVSVTAITIKSGIVPYNNNIFISSNDHHEDTNCSWSSPFEFFVTPL